MIITVKIKVGDECNELCKYNGKTRYAQPPAMHLPEEPYYATNWCQLFRKDLKVDEANKPIMCNECAEARG